jgi:hypothetical protein
MWGNIFRHWSLSVALFLVCPAALAQNQTIDGGGCGANVGSVSGNVSINIDCGPSKSDQLSVQYVRLFGAAEVPLLMTLFGQPKMLPSSAFGQRFRTVLSPDGEEIPVGKNLVQFFNRYSFRNARPLLTKIWTDVARNEASPAAIYWLATAGSKRERICYFATLEADESGYELGQLIEEKLIPNEKSCKSTIRTFGRRIGFTFIVIQNDGARPIDDVKVHYRQSYSSKEILREEPEDLSKYLATGQLELLPDSDAPGSNLVAIYGEASEAETMLKRSPTDWLYAARLEPKEKLIALLNIYVADGANLPAAYLSGIYEFDTIDYSIEGMSRSMKVRAPALRRAARVMVPYGWASQ